MQRRYRQLHQRSQIDILYIAMHVDRYHHTSKHMDRYMLTEGGSLLLQGEHGPGLWLCAEISFQGLGWRDPQADACFPRYSYLSCPASPRSAESFAYAWLTHGLRAMRLSAKAMLAPLRWALALVAVSAA